MSLFSLCASSFAMFLLAGYIIYMHLAMHEYSYVLQSMNIQEQSLFWFCVSPNALQSFSSSDLLLYLCNLQIFTVLSIMQTT